MTMPGEPNPLESLAVSWIASLFSQELPIPLALRVLDAVFVSETIEPLHRVALVLYERAERSVLLATDWVEVAVAIKSSNRELWEENDPTKGNSTGCLADGAHATGLVGERPSSPLHAEGGSLRKRQLSKSASEGGSERQGIRVRWPWSWGAREEAAIEDPAQPGGVGEVDGDHPARAEQPYPTTSRVPIDRRRSEPAASRTGWSFPFSLKSSVPSSPTPTGYVRGSGESRSPTPESHPCPPPNSATETRFQDRDDVLASELSPYARGRVPIDQDVDSDEEEAQEESGQRQETHCPVPAENETSTKAGRLERRASELFDAAFVGSRRSTDVERILDEIPRVRLKLSKKKSM
jgi:hypothetical protein